MAEVVPYPTGWMYNWNSFNIERNSFEEDVHILILGTLHAGVTYLREEAEKENEKITPHIKGASERQLQRIGEVQSDIWGYLGGQERFLHHMALVALISRITHALNSMIRSADSIAERDPKGYGGKNEFQKLWREFEYRFGIKCPPKHIAFIEPLRRARNLIVHNGGDANPLKPEEEIDADTAYEDLRDLTFSNRYPKYVTGEGSNAEVNITEKQLEYVIEKSVNLIKWLSIELRAKQKVYLDKTLNMEPRKMKSQSA